jgi:hypothetical protein
MRVIYRDGVIQVETDGKCISFARMRSCSRITNAVYVLCVTCVCVCVACVCHYLDGAGHWVPCITHHESLPKGYYFGLSAATGHLTDNHDVFSFITYNLDPWRRRPPVPPRQQVHTQAVVTLSCRV